ncbi:MAG: M23 family metallopeptidase [Deltaproteobacteria bacterium]|jgi:murein DD-endopeptidase MepM/ murein hydrolase activator NlpD|nr:M23 family metallopeptidase [Deltaproteobacteria bacterium]
MPQKLSLNNFNLILTLALGGFFWALGLGGFEPLAAQELPAKVDSLKVLPQPLDRGTVGLVELAEGSADCLGDFDNRPIFFFSVKKDTKKPGSAAGIRWVGLFGADIMLKPGTYPLKVTCPGVGEARAQVVVRDKSYGVRVIKVPQAQVRLSEENQRRAAQEKVLVDQALATRSPERLWSGAFLEPVNGQVNSSFGRQTKLNGVLNPRPHAGADFLVPTGTPVKAPARGRVILTGDHFFSGKAVYLDHGQGLISMYFHLSEIDVQDGDMVDKGQVIAKSGQSGRVTGAHLHYGVYLNGARIDPMPFRKMTSRL